MSCLFLRCTYYTKNKGLYHTSDHCTTAFFFQETLFIALEQQHADYHSSQYTIPTPASYRLLSDTKPLGNITFLSRHVPLSALSYLFVVFHLQQQASTLFMTPVKPSNMRNSPISFILIRHAFRRNTYIQEISCPGSVLMQIKGEPTFQQAGRPWCTGSQKWCRYFLKPLFLSDIKCESLEVRTLII